MIEMHGDEMLAAVKSECAERNLPCPPSIACTGNASLSDRREYERLGFVGTMAKPFGVAVLLEFLREWGPRARA
eukprot:CAMPEP_0196794696 /NCGR_PEP_ID=MMETSP1104-20130614/34839_1 /TAXON_ID=33652 /ORGANISM="Cafeteria sp., Strain Caron Lab Isolate" /LENGTH=73 /DNA_ID=CAMNT_0042165077 /DNA_START=30 /DNA_END=247 /DNA_ORIENTATION=+